MAGAEIDLRITRACWHGLVDWVSLGWIINPVSCMSTSNAAPRLSNKHNRIAEFHEDEGADLTMPAGYKHSISI